jgi:hypothetical protein
LVPPAWKGAAQRLSLCPIAYLLSVFAIFGCFFLPLGNEERRKMLLKDKAIWVSIVSGFAIAFVTPTSYSYEEGRWGGYLWAVVQRLPEFGGRSVFFAFTAPLGAAVVIAVWREMQEAGLRREALLWLSAVCGWAASFAVNRQVFQRYYEPMVLVFLALATFHLEGRASRPAGSLVWRLLVLAVMQTAITFATVFRAAIG